MASLSIEEGSNSSSSSLGSNVSAAASCASAAAAAGSLETAGTTVPTLQKVLLLLEVIVPRKGDNQDALCKIL